MKSKTKRILAFLCAVVLVVTTFLGNWYTKQGEVKAADTVEPISVDGFENVTLNNFVDSSEEQMPEMTYSDTTGGGVLKAYSLASGENLNGKLVSMKVKFTGGGGNARFDVGGIGEWSGFSLYASTTSNYLHIYTNYNWSDPAQGFDINASTAGLSAVLDTEFILQMSIKYIDGDTDSVEVGVYINGTLCNTCTITGVSPEKFGGYLGIYCQDTAAITVSGVEWPAEPVQLEGYTNLTLNDFVDSSDNMFADGEYAGGTTAVYHAANVSNFDNVLLSMKVKFNTANYRASITFGGNGEWCGMNLHPASNGTQLVLDTSWAGNYASYSPITMYAATAGVDSFLDEEFLVQISFDYADLTATTTDLTLGFYIEGKLYNNQTFTISSCQVANVANYLSLYRETSSQSISVESVDLRKEPVYVDGFTPISLENFVHESTGAQMQEGTYAGASTGAHSPHKLTNATNFDGKLLSMYVTLEGTSYMNSIIVSGNGGWAGFNIYADQNGSKLVFGKTWGSSMTSSSGPSLDASTAGVSSFLNNEFLLQISFDYVDPTATTTNLVMGVYIDGKLYNNQTFTVASCTMANVGAYLSIYGQVDGQNITVGNVTFPKFAGFTQVTLEDFADASGNDMEAKAYTTTSKGAYDTFSLKDYDNFDKKVLALNVMFKDGSGNTRIDIAGAGGWKGLSMWSNAAGSYLFVASNYGGVSSGTPTFPIEINKDSVGISSFLDTKFLLEMTFRYVSTNQIEIGIYINGVQANGQNYTLTASDINHFGDYIAFYRENDDSAILVGSVNDEYFPEDVGKQPSYRYEKLTFGHFGITDGKYPYVSGDVAVQGAAVGRTTLDKTVICGSILYEGSNSSQIIWGGKSGWNGLRMFPNSAGHMALSWYEGSTGTPIETLTSDIAGVAFVGEEYDIMLSSELVDNGGDGNVNDIKIGIWFNGVLYNQQYFYATDLGDKYGNYFSVYCATETDTVTLGSVMDLLEQPSESLKKITFTQFGVDDGVYESASDVNTKGTYIKGDTVNGTVLCGDIQLINSSAGEIDIFLGSNTNVWTEGIRLVKYGSSQNFSLTYQTSAGVQNTWTITPAVAGVDFATEKFNLMWSMELVDSDEDGSADDLKVGLWFNGFLYNQSYIYIADFGTDVLGNTFATYCATGTSIALNCMYEYAQLPDQSFDKITFSDFGLETGEYVCGADVVASSKASAYTTLDRVVFSGDFRFSDEGNYQIIYGGDSGWSGLRFMIESDGSMNVSWYKGNESQLVVWTTPEYAKVSSFTENTFNLMISTELVDNDGDGNKNDIKVGVWFNGILYEYNGSEYHIVKDWGDQLLNGFSVYGASGDAVSVLLRNVGDYQKNPYYYEDISSYRGDTKTAPEAPTGYVFSGWYADADYTEWIGTDVTSGSAWAKFVEDDVLSAKPQIQLNNGALPTDSTSLRVATTVDSLEYRRISFFIAKKQTDGSYGTEFNTATVSDENARMVYEKLYAIGSNSETITYKPTAFSWQSDYFKTFTLTGIPYADYGVVIKVTPYWITMDGTLVRGKVLETCVNDYGKNTSEAVSVSFIGDDTLPITGYHGPYVATDANDAMLFPDYVTDEYFKLIADSGVNVIISSNMDYAKYPDQVKKALELAEKYGVGIYVQDSTLLTLTMEADVKAQLANYSDYESFVGIYLIDEPGTDTYKSDDGKNVSDYKTIAGILNDLGILTYVNMYPIVDTTTWWDRLWGASDEENYSNYVAEVNSTLNPAALTWDYYPFAVPWNSDGTISDTVQTTHPEYFWNMGEIRRQAQAANKPFWAYVQAGSNWNNSSKYFETLVYAPSEGQFKWNMNTALAFGAQGIQYFPLIQPYHFAYGTDATHWDFNRNGLISAFGNTTQWYDYAQEANTHVGAMDHILMDSYSTQIIAIGSAQDDTSDVSGVTTTVSYNELTSASGNALIGCFDYKGKTALYVVNYDYDNAGTVTLNFNGTYDITKIENAQTTETSASSMSLSMEAGEGILLVIE